jgi:hypothetical protein
MTNHHTVPEQPDPDDLGEECLPLTISVAPEYVERLEQLAARTGRTADQVLEDFVRRLFAPFGGRLLR